jgi:predicted nucleic acid-binding protein
VISPRHVLLDACACINLAAAFPLRSLEADLGRPIRIVREAANESLFLHQVENEERVKVRIEVEVIKTIALEPSELELYVHLAKRLGDGEAASLAVAHHRRLELVTDDRAARRAATLDAPNAQVTGTASLLRALSSAKQLAEDEVAQAIQRVELHASFRPSKDDPDLDWWLAARNTSAE